MNRAWRKPTLGALLMLAVVLAVVLTLRVCSKPPHPPIIVAQPPVAQTSVQVSAQQLPAPMPPRLEMPPVVQQPPTSTPRLQKPVNPTPAEKCKSSQRVINNAEVEWVNCQGQKFLCKSVVVSKENVLIPPPENDSPACFERDFWDELQEPLNYTCCPASSW